MPSLLGVLALLTASLLLFALPSPNSSGYVAFAISCKSFCNCVSFFVCAYSSIDRCQSYLAPSDKLLYLVPSSFLYLSQRILAIFFSDLLFITEFLLADNFNSLITACLCSGCLTTKSFSSWLNEAHSSALALFCFSLSPLLRYASSFLLEALSSAAALSSTHLASSLVRAKVLTLEPPAVTVFDWSISPSINLRGLSTPPPTSSSIETRFFIGVDASNWLLSEEGYFLAK